MTFYDYQLFVRRFRQPESTPNAQLLGLAAETGEVLSLFQKLEEKKWQYNRLDIAHELGDVLWRLTAVADDNGFDLIEIAALNENKIRKRYGGSEQ